MAVKKLLAEGVQLRRAFETFGSEHEPEPDWQQRAESAETRLAAIRTALRELYKLREIRRFYPSINPKAILAAIDAVRWADED